MKRKLTALALAVLFCLALAACSAASYGGNSAAASPQAADYAGSAPSTGEKEGNADSGSSKAADYNGVAAENGVELPEDGSGFSPADDRKLIRQASLDVQTKDFDASLSGLDALIASTGSFIESRNVTGYNPDNSYSQRSASIVVRVPAEKLDEFLAAKDTLGSVLSSNVWQDDVTMTYVDTEARLNTLKVKRERLLALLEKATDMESIVDLETALSDTEYQIESYQSSMTRLENQIAYSTVTISLREVARESAVSAMPRTLGERISYQFARTVESTRTFFEDFVVFLVGSSPVLLFLLVVIAALVLGLRAGTKKRARREEAERQARAEAEKKRLSDGQDAPPSGGENRPEGK